VPGEVIFTDIDVVIYNFMLKVLLYNCKQIMKELHTQMCSVYALIVIYLRLPHLLCRHKCQAQTCKALNDTGQPPVQWVPGISRG
jgi:hypothetical protein